MNRIAWLGQTETDRAEDDRIAAYESRRTVSVTPPLSPAFWFTFGAFLVLALVLSFSGARA